MAKGVNTSFRGPLLAAMQEYAERNGMTLQDANRELVQLGLSVAPADTLIQNAKQRAYDDVRRFVMEKFSEKLTELSKDMEKVVGLEIWGTQKPRNG